MAGGFYKCKVCGGKIEKDLADLIATKINNRYVHIECLEKKEEISKQQIKDMHDFCKKYIINYDEKRAESKLREYVFSKNYSYEDVIATLKYWFAIRHEDGTKANGGIGIVEYVIDDAKKYFRSQQLLKEMNDREMPAEVEMSAKYRRKQIPKAKMIKPRNRRWVDLD